MSVILLTLLGLVGLTYAPGVVYRRISEARLQRMCRGKLILTYDDGPTDGVPTPQLLDALARRNAKATFFLLGQQVAKHPEMCARLQQGGHDLGSHSYEHKQAWKAPLASIVDIARGVHAVAPWQSGPAIYRQPFGKSTLWTLLSAWRLRAQPIWWTVDSGDSWKDDPNTDEVIARLERAQGGVVLMHDYPRDSTTNDGSFTIALTERLLDLADERGWRVCTISELLYDSAA